MSDLKLIPLFPLEIVVFPEETLNLHIFEPRYRQLVADADQSELLFGIPYYKDGIPLIYGSTVRLDKIVNTYSNGRIDIKTIGVDPIEIKRYIKKYPDKLYPGGFVQNLYWDKNGNPDYYKEIKEKLNDLYGFMKITKIIEPLTRDFVTFEIAHKVGFTIDQEFNFLKIPGEIDRQIIIIEHLNKMIPKIKAMEEMRKKIQLNGHFRRINPPKV